MRNCCDLVPIARTIADALNDGLTIGFETVDGEQSVVVKDSAGGFEVSVTVSHPRVICPKDYRFVYGKSAAKEKPQPSDEENSATVAAKKKSAKWWSRYNFEKNIMQMTLLSMQRIFPADISFNQHEFAVKLASMMHWKISTAKRHITEAAKMGILNRVIIGTAYHITGVNTDDAQTLKEEMAERHEEPEQMPLFDCPDDETTLPRTALEHEGRPLFEKELEKAVDETILP